MDAAAGALIASLTIMMVLLLLSLLEGRRRTQPVVDAGVPSETIPSLRATPDSPDLRRKEERLMRDVARLAQTPERPPTTPTVSKPRPSPPATPASAPSPSPTLTPSPPQASPPDPDEPPTDPLVPQAPEGPSSELLASLDVSPDAEIEETALLPTMGSPMEDTAKPAPAPTELDQAPVEPAAKAADATTPPEGPASDARAREAQLAALLGDFVAKLQNDASYKVRLEAADKLASLGDDRAVPYLLYSAKADESVFVRSRCRKILRETFGVEPN